MIKRVTALMCERDCKAILIGENARDVLKEARAKGWRISDKHGDQCPECRRESQPSQERRV